MKRDEWQFEYTASKLAEAARSKATHHAERQTWWEKQKENVMREVRESGIEVSESLAANYRTTSEGFGPQVMVRNDLQRRLTECHEKIKEHRGKTSQYDGWQQVLSANPESRLQLTHDDWLFFFGRTT